MFKELYDLLKTFINLNDELRGTRNELLIIKSEVNTLKLQGVKHETIIEMQLNKKASRK